MTLAKQGIRLCAALCLLLVVHSPAKANSPQRGAYHDLYLQVFIEDFCIGEEITRFITSEECARIITDYSDNEEECQNPPPSACRKEINEPPSLQTSKQMCERIARFRHFSENIINEFVPILVKYFCEKSIIGGFYENYRELFYIYFISGSPYFDLSKARQYACAMQRGELEGHETAIQLLRLWNKDLKDCNAEEQ